MTGLSNKPRRLRRLSDEEIALWAEVARSVAKRPGARLPEPAAPVAKPPPKFAPKIVAKIAPKIAPKLAPTLKPPPPPSLQPFDAALQKNLARGRSAVDSAIDLHGMTQAQAHSALRGFLRQAQMQGAKLVIVITGKGEAKATAGSWGYEPGALRRQTPHWLAALDMRDIVLGFEEAGRAHGGAGALYVRLRRRPSH